jgi:ABC-2 type transport system ATP-binding protein
MLVAQQLTKTFGARTAVEDVSFDIAAGEIFALVGPNGAGKTTTLRMLAGLISPSSGAVKLGGAPMATSSSLRAGIGFLTEAPGLWDRLTVRQNLRVHAALHGLSRPARAVDAAMDLFGVRDRAGEAAAVLSKGLRQRVALARTLLHDPRVVLLDEPTSGLDPESARDVRELVLRLRHERRAVLISTHNLDEVDRLANRVALLKTRLVALDTPERLRARVFGSRVRIVLAGGIGAHAAALRAAGIADVREEGQAALSIGLDRDGAPDTPALVRRLVEGGAAIERVEREEPSLEQVYLRLMTPEERR